MQNINVNIVPDNFPQTIRYSQGDIGRQFKINVADFDIPVGATVKIQATKPSGFGFSVAGVVADNSVTFTTTAEMTDEAGRFQAELQITAGDDVIGTANFLMIGERNPHPEGTTDGSQGTIIPELTLLVERVEAAASSVLDMEVVATTLPAGSQATYSYDEDLNKATFGIPEGQAGAGAAGVVASAYSAAKTYKVGDYVLYNSNLYRCTTAITTAEAWTAAHWTQIVLADDVTDLKTDLNLVVKSYNAIEPYLYKKDTYINSSGVETALNGYDLYRIPLGTLDYLNIKWDSSNIFWQGLNYSYVFYVQALDGTYVKPIVGDGELYYVPYDLQGTTEAFFVKRADMQAVMVCVKRGSENLIGFYLNGLDIELKTKQIEYIEDVNDTNALKSKVYINTSGRLATLGNSSAYSVYYKKVKTGDVINMTGTITGLWGCGLFVNADWETTVISLNATSFVAPSNGIVEIFVATTSDRAYTIHPIDSIKIDAKNVMGLNVGKQFDGLNGVAFGTSLTYRAISSYGFLTKLSELSGITFDNQGIGSSTILGGMLTAIKGYSGYSGKRVALLEGFVNDWYQGLTLGNYTDTTEDTVCGCVRSAINYMLSQNANLTVFLILDHYGKLASDVDCRTTAENDDGLTQYEYYEEIAKVAESLGIPVIKEYEVSQISENTPQYLADNIHLNALGADQSAYAIWSEMVNRYPNLI